jgi:outer membrane protein TolC
MKSNRGNFIHALSLSLALVLSCQWSVSLPASAAQNPAGPTQLPSVSPVPGNSVQIPANAPSPAGTGPVLPPSIAPPQEKTTDIPANTLTPNLAPITVPSGFTLRELPGETPAQAQSAEVLKSSPIRLGALIQVASLKPLSLDARFNQPISLAEALSYTLEKSLPIRISQESAFYQATQLAYYMTFFLPAFSANYALANSGINGTTHTSAQIFSTKLSFPLFAGGSYAYFTMAQYFRTKGWREAYQANVNDALLDAYNKYTNLVLNHQLLRIRIKSVELSEAQLKTNTAQYQAGAGTKFAIMQARTQLAADRQNLLAQQVATRQAALLLSYGLDMPLSINLVPTDLDIAQRPLILSKATIQKLLNIAMQNRPELREYEHFRLAAAKDVQIGTANLYPAASIFIAYTNSDLTFTGNPNNVNGVAVTQISLGGLNNGAAGNTALGQTAAFSPGSTSAASGNTNAGGPAGQASTNTNRTNTQSNPQATALGQNANISPGYNLTATAGANTGAATIVAASGGIPLANTQSGSLVTSGAVAPGIISPVSVNGTSGSSNINGSSTSSAGSAPGVFNTFQSGFNLTWSLPNLGMNSVANIVALRALSRQALVQANQQSMIVQEQVRTAYLNSLSATNQIEQIGSQLDSATEALRLAELRLHTGQGTNLELIRAQTDYVNGLIVEAQSYIAFQQAQAQLIHDLGVININTLTQGYSPANQPFKR